MEYEGDRDINCKWCARKNSKRFVKVTERLRNQRRGEDHPNYRNEIVLNNVKSLEDLREVALLKNPAKDHQPTFVSKKLSDNASVQKLSKE